MHKSNYFQISNELPEGACGVKKMLIDGDLYSLIIIFVFYSLLIEKKESKNNKVQQLASNIL